MPAEKQIMILFAGANGYLDEWPVESIEAYEKEMLEFMDSKHAAILSEIKEQTIISDELEDKMNKVLDEFKSVFHPAS